MSETKVIRRIRQILECLPLVELPPKPIVIPPGAPETILEASQRIDAMLRNVVDQLDFIVNALLHMIPEEVTDYTSIEENVTSASPDLWLIEKDLLKRPSKRGYITNDSTTDSLTIEINDGPIITLEAEETFKWPDNVKRVLVVSKILIKTTSTSAVNYRLFAI